MAAKLTIIYEHGPDGWWVATIPEVPGAFSQGKTKESARANVLNALQELMIARRKLALRARAAESEVETVPLAG